MKQIPFAAHVYRSAALGKPTPALRRCMKRLMASPAGRDALRRTLAADARLAAALPAALTPQMFTAWQLAEPGPGRLVAHGGGVNA